LNKPEQVEAIRHLVDEVFNDVKWPSPDILVAHSPENAFRRLEEPSIREHFGGKRQHDFDGVNGQMVEELLSMSRPAIHYYLPWFLKALLTTTDFLTVVSFIQFLDIERSVAQGVFWPHFTDKQTAAILACVEFVMQHIKSYGLDPFEDENRKLLQRVRRQWKHIRG
jgi:hypothetical protein